MSLLTRLAVQAAKGFGALSSGGVKVNYLVVAGGGGGGGNAANGAGTGGGGAGGYRESTTTLSSLTTYTIAVGSGGSSSAASNGLNGSDSSILGTGLATITSTGGGLGSYANSSSGGNGGSGGGSGRNVSGQVGGTGTVGQGNNGGDGYDGAPYRGGGGGGASAVGATGTASGNGGAGTASSISGSSVTYAGGGGGGVYSSTTVPGGTGGTGGGGAGGAGGSSLGTAIAGSVNTGGGGGGGASNNSTGNAGAAGGSGIVIISYTSATPKFVGGTITTSGGKQIHTFTSSGSLSPITPITASYLVVAGGAGGGGGNGYITAGGGGGGAGGLLTSSTTLYSGATYVVTVGAGGAGGTGAVSGSIGSNSVLSGTGLTTVTSTGGGYGGNNVNGGAGGSGGGGGGSSSTKTGGAGNTPSTTPAQGFAGGSNSGAPGTPNYGAGGGGGASAVGSNATTSVGGNGGAGTASSISGSSVTYAGGGGGGMYAGGTAGTGGSGGGGNGGTTGSASSATTNTGSGGGGSGSTAANTNFVGGSGGSGTVIISYAGSQVFNGGLVTSSGGNTIHTFNATGALTPVTNNLNNSLRFRSSASAYLNRTPTVAGNRQTWTISFWWKRGLISSEQYIVSADTNSANETWLRINAADTLQFQTLGGTNANLTTSALFRDPSAWYHIVMAYDSTQATAGNRFKLYVNGNQQTLTGTNPTLNESQAINNTVSQQFCRRVSTSTSYADNYLTDVYLIDGQALEPYYFGNNDAYGNWKPIQYKGTYGTNGFYLNFADTSALTTSSNAGLGKDTSGNGNYYATNNVSITAGVTYDAMLDVPTNTSANVANYCTLNPLDNGGLTISSASLKASTTSTNYYSTRCSMAVPSSGKYYWEYTVTAQDTGVGSWFSIGMATASVALTGFIGGVAGSIYYGDRNDATSQILNETATVYTGTAIAFVTNDILQIAYDADTGKFWFGKNNAWWDSSAGTTGNPSAGTNQTLTAAANTYFPLIQLRIGTSGTNTADINFGQRPFTYTPPAGYVALNTYNLSTPTILQGNLYMDATLYTGTSSAQSITNAAGFKPDFVWGKARSTTRFNVLVDSVRGSSKDIYSNATNAEYTDATVISSINSNGFSLGTDAELNLSTNTFVAWQWQAGQGTTTVNTSGATSSNVSVSTTAGFSIVTYTGTGANTTIGHGLSAAPKMVIVKNRGSAVAWAAWHTSIANTQYLVLNTTAAAATGATWWNSTTPTSSVISVGTSTSTNASGNTYVAYCWSEIEGFSKFGSYTGNGSADGPFVYLGFRPKFIITKMTSGIDEWTTLDSARSDVANANPNDQVVSSGTSAAESSGSGYGNPLAVDFLSNGFKIRGTQNSNNNSGSTFIYMAYAENPFKNSNAK